MDTRFKWGVCGHRQDTKQVDQTQDAKERWGSRHTFVLLSFFGIALVYSLRFSLPLALVAMGDNRFPSIVCHISIRIVAAVILLSDVIPAYLKRCWIAPIHHSWQSQAEKQNYQWLVLGAYYAGFAISIIPSDILSGRISNKWLVCLGVTVSSLITLLFPMAAKTDSVSFACLRVVQGLVEGVALPAYFRVAANWLNGHERSLLMSSVHVASVIAPAASGAIAEYLGWEFIFYTTAALGVVWFAAWTILVHDKPEDNPRISDAELAHIQSLRGHLTAAVPHIVSLPPPLTKILTSPAAMAYLVAVVGANWGYHTLSNGIPMYLSDVHNLSIKEIGITTSLPYACFLVVSLLVPTLSAKLSRSVLVSDTNSLKVFHSVGVYLPAVGMFALSHVGGDDNAAVALALLCLSVGLSAAVTSGAMMSLSNLDSESASALLGLGTSLSCISGFGAPSVTGIITSDNSPDSWNSVFLLTACVYIVSGTFYNLFGSTKIFNEEESHAERENIDSSDIYYIVVVKRGDDDPV